MKITKSNCSSFGFSSPVGEPFQPLILPMILLPKKEGGKFWVYFRFLMIQNPTITANATITAASIMAVSVVINGASVGSVGSGSIGPDGAAAGPTDKPVASYELQ
jgi:hypothetical protein